MKAEMESSFDNALVALSYYMALHDQDDSLKAALEKEYGAMNLLTSSFALLTFLVHFNGDKFSGTSKERETASVQNIRERIVALAVLADRSS